MSLVLNMMNLWHLLVHLVEDLQEMGTGKRGRDMVKPRSPAFQANALPSEPSGKPFVTVVITILSVSVHIPVSIILITVFGAKF